MIFRPKSDDLVQKSPILSPLFCSKKPLKSQPPKLIPGKFPSHPVTHCAERVACPNLPSATERRRRVAVMERLREDSDSASSTEARGSKQRSCRGPLADFMAPHWNMETNSILYIYTYRLLYIYILHIYIYIYCIYIYIAYIYIVYIYIAYTRSTWALRRRCSVEVSHSQRNVDATSQNSYGKNNKGTREY